MEEGPFGSIDHIPGQMINRIRSALGEKPTSVFSLRLPRSLREKLSLMARKEGIPENQFVTLALAEKIASLQTEEEMRRTAEVGDREKIGAENSPNEVPKEESVKPTFDEIWRRIVEHEHEVFTQIRGGRFAYEVKGNYVRPDRTNQNISRKDFQSAYAFVPLSGTAVLQHLRGPSYLYAILMDGRIRQNDW
jgi:hypothetical protein